MVGRVSVFLEIVLIIIVILFCMIVSRSFLRNDAALIYFANFMWKCSSVAMLRIEMLLSNLFGRREKFSEVKPL